MMHTKSMEWIKSIANLSRVDHGQPSWQLQQQLQAQLQLQLQQQLQPQQQQQLQLHQQQLQQQQQLQHQQQQQQQQQHQQQQHQQHQQQQHQQQQQLQQQQQQQQQLQKQQQAQQQQQQKQQQQKNHLQQQQQQQLQIPSNGARNSASSKASNNKHHPPERKLIDFITCKLCKGYLVDATTLDLCMHTFCRPCVIKFIKEKPRCPECNLAIKDKRYLHRLKTDVTLQNLVYKLTPGLYEKEMARRRKFYEVRPVQPPRYKSEMFGDIPPSKTIKDDDMLNVCIAWNRNCPEEEPIKTYLHLRADSTILVLRKLIIAKFGLDKPIKIYYGNSEISFDLTTLMDVASTFNWAPDSKILNLNFNDEEEVQGDKIKKDTNKVVKEEKMQINSSSNSLHLTSFGHESSSDPSRNPC